MKKEHNYWVYIVTNWKKTVLYTGVTNDLVQRLKEHYDKRGNEGTFTGRYYCHNLVYYEHHQYIQNAIAREKEIKLLDREKKNALVASFNPEWRFLNRAVCDAWPPRYDGRIAEEKPMSAPSPLLPAEEPDWTFGLVPPPDC